MTKTSTPIIFFGNERLATDVKTDAPVLQALIANGYEVKAVVANYVGAAHGKRRELEIAEVAAAHHIPLLLPSKLRDIQQQLTDYHAHVGILAAYGKIVSPEIIDIFPAGIINLHPSLLPHWRGPTPIESAILQGDKITGVSIMKLVKEMDAGPIYGQAELTLNGNETKQQLADSLSELGRATLIELLPGILNHSVHALPQDEAHATYDHLLNKEDGLIDWHKPAEQLEREIRAFSGWPGSRATIANKDVLITEAKVLDLSGQPGSIIGNNKSLVIYCGNKSLEIIKLKPLGKTEMSSQAFLAGYGRNLRRT